VGVGVLVVFVVEVVDVLVLVVVVEDWTFGVGVVTGGGVVFVGAGGGGGGSAPPPTQSHVIGIRPCAASAIWSKAAGDRSKLP